METIHAFKAAKGKVSARRGGVVGLLKLPSRIERMREVSEQQKTRISLSLNTGFCFEAYCIFYWCREPESNRHALRRGILSPVRLPVPPSRQRKLSIMRDFADLSKTHIA